MPRKRRFVISAIVTQGFTQGSFRPDDFLSALQASWGHVVSHEVDEHLWMLHYVLHWEVPNLILQGRLADDYHRIEFQAVPDIAAKVGVWYRAIVPAHLRLAFVIVGAYRGAHIELTAAIAPDAIELYVIRSKNRTETPEAKVSLGNEPMLQGLIEIVGDQRAKDLMDRVSSEIDHRRAIRLAHRALQYGKTTIQAAKAYQELSYRYEQLGNQKRTQMYAAKAETLGSADQLSIFQKEYQDTIMRLMADQSDNLPA